MIWLSNPHYCTRGGAEHAFEPRYDTTARLPTRLTSLGFEAMAYAANIMDRTSTYQGDVCVRCGKVINRTEPKA